jgi:hypothetical protein
VETPSQRVQKSSSISRWPRSFLIPSLHPLPFILLPSTTHFPPSADLQNGTAHSTMSSHSSVQTISQSHRRRKVSVSSQMSRTSPPLIPNQHTPPMMTHSSHSSQAIDPIPLENDREFDAMLSKFLTVKSQPFAASGRIPMDVRELQLFFRTTVRRLPMLNFGCIEGSFFWFRRVARIASTFQLTSTTCRVQPSVCSMKRVGRTPKNRVMNIHPPFFDSPSSRQRARKVPPKRAAARRLISQKDSRFRLLSKSQIIRCWTPYATFCFRICLLDIISPLNGVGLKSSLLERLLVQRHPLRHRVMQ